MSSQNISIAPLVLLSVVDHYKRLSSPRVAGVLLGSAEGKKVTVTNSFAVPFEESDDGFFLDTSYLQNMFDLYWKVNCKEKILGWYHSGPKLCKSDLEITKSISRYATAPILAVINVHMSESGIPCQVFRLSRDNDLIHMNVQIGADETEEVGVEHLLRDIKESTGCSIKDKLGNIVDSLKIYNSSLLEIIAYLEEIQAGRKPNKKILNLLQEVLNNVPRYQSEVDLNKVYLSELATTFVAMNDLKNNKMERRRG